MRGDEGTTEDESTCEEVRCLFPVFLFLSFLSIFRYRRSRIASRSDLRAIILLLYPVLVRTGCLCLSHAVMPCRLDIRRKGFHLFPRFRPLHFRILLHDRVLLSSIRMITLHLLSQRQYTIMHHLQPYCILCYCKPVNAVRC